ncbi:hypothetical protein [Diaminobutyricibacter sp. McL0608]|uniref:hypothetical protein n=1 Tax=Leifsonia sp. McL0608 TaxID=3143537 RepID=UPI0031F2EB2E
MSLTLKRPTDEPDEVQKVTKPKKGEPKPTKQKAAKSGPSSKPAPSKGGRPGVSYEVGAEPRVDLLPPEVRAQRKAASTRRGLGFAVLASVLLVGLAAGGSAFLAFSAQASLTESQQQTSSLLAQQSKYISVRKLQDQVALATAAQQVGASTEIDWKTYLNKVQATLPANVVIDTVTVDSASPLAQYSQSTAPLQGARVATVTFDAKSSTLPEVPAWLTALAKLPGFADATPGTVTLDQTSKVYSVNITMHVNDAAFDQRFSPKEK